MAYGRRVGHVFGRATPTHHELPDIDEYGTGLVGDAFEEFTFGETIESAGDVDRRQSNRAGQVLDAHRGTTGAFGHEEATASSTAKSVGGRCWRARARVLRRKTTVERDVITHGEKKM